MQIDIKQPQILKNVAIFRKNTVNLFSKGFAYYINMASHPVFCGLNVSPDLCYPL